MNIGSMRSRASLVEEMAGSCLSLLSRCSVLTTVDLTAQDELIKIIALSRHIRELCEQLKQSGIRNTDEKERGVAHQLESHFSVIDVLEKRLRIIIRGQLGKIDIIKACCTDIDDD